MENLLNKDALGFEEGWSTLFLNVPAVQELKTKLTPEQAQKLVHEGQYWTGSHWNTSTASKKIYDLSGVPIVSADIGTYRDLFLYALCLFLGVEVPSLELQDRVADGAFALAAVLMGEAPWQTQAPTVVDEDGTSDEEEDVVIDWDEPLESLPAELAFLFAHTAAGERKADLKTILGTVPKFRDLPTAAPVNNHRQDGARKQDTEKRAYQQALLNIMRMEAATYSRMKEGKLIKQQLEQLFQITVDLYVRIQNSRKELSIPGSVTRQTEVLFDKQELGNAQMQQRINRSGGKGKGWSLTDGPHSRDVARVKALQWAEAGATAAQISGLLSTALISSQGTVPTKFPRRSISLRSQSSKSMMLIYLFHVRLR